MIAIYFDIETKKFFIEKKIKFMFLILMKKLLS